MIFNRLYFTILLFLLCSFTSFSNDTIIGLPFIHNYSTENYQLQNWAIVEDNRNIVYFGNGSGVLEFDGKNLNSIPTSNNSTVRSLDIDANGTVFVGATAELGFLATNSIGKTHFVSLLPKIPEEYKNFTRVLKTLAISDGVYFITEDVIFRFYNDSIYCIPAQLKNQQRYGFKVFDKIFLIQENKGLYYIDINTLTKLPHSNPFSSDFKRYIISPYYNNHLLIATEKKGLYTYDLNMISHKGKIFQNNTNKNTSEAITKRIYSSVQTFIDEHGLYSAAKSNGNYYFGTITGGVIITDSTLNIIQIINKSKGLRGNSVLDIKADHKNNIWLALQDGVAYIEQNSPIRYFDNKNDLDGIVLTTTNFKNQRYVGTHLGIFKLDDYKFNTNNDNYHFTLIPETNTTCLMFHQINGKLLASTNKGILQIKNDKSKIIIENKTPYCFHESPKFKNTLFMGTSDGFEAYKLGNNLEILDYYKYPEITEAIIHIESDSLGNLWLTSQLKGIIKITFSEKWQKDYMLTHFDTTHGLPSLNLNYLYNLQDKLMIATRKGIYQTIYSPELKSYSFIPDTSFCHKSVKESSFSKIVETTKNYFLLSEESGIGIINRNYHNQINYIPLKKINPESIYNIFIEDKLLWICTTEGLFKFNINNNNNYNTAYPVLIRSVVAKKDSSLFKGTFYADTLTINDNFTLFVTTQNKNLIPEINYKNNEILFSYSAPEYNSLEDITFRYKLEGFEENWSDWSPKNEKSYTNLWEGEYTFNVQAKNIYTKTSSIASYSFVIVPPLYRTIVAYIIYILFTIFIFIIGFRLYARRLVAQNIKLEKTIKERTTEIRKQRDQIATQNQNITDSIHYASRIQNALLPPHDQIKKAFADYFILYKPRDIVSGDFYWNYTTGNKMMITAADCTGHGVPGAFMSMLGISFLNEIVNKNPSIKANEILNELRTYIKTSLRQTGKKDETKDGMDMAMCIFDFEEKILQFSGANNPLYLIRNNELIQYKADRMPIGIYIKDDRLFTNNEIKLENEDCIYIFSDGYVDQFGGVSGKKFMPKNFKSLLLEHHKKPMSYQKEILDQTMENWKGTQEQIDDILVIGIHIKW